MSCICFLAHFLVVGVILDRVSCSFILFCCSLDLPPPFFLVEWLFCLFNTRTKSTNVGSMFAYTLHTSCSYTFFLYARSSCGIHVFDQDERSSRAFLYVLGSFFSVNECFILRWSVMFFLSFGAYFVLFFSHSRDEREEKGEQIGKKRFFHGASIIGCEGASSFLLACCSVRQDIQMGTVLFSVHLTPHSLHIPTTHRRA